MKHFLLLLGCIAGLVLTGKAQVMSSAANTARQPDTTLAHRITQKLSDSLSLSAEQRRQAFAINRWVDSSKVAVIRTYHGRDSLNILMEKLEHTRDSLYLRLLTDKQLMQYGLHKRTLVLNN
jgi:hypothetical protein